MCRAHTEEAAPLPRLGSRAAAALTCSRAGTAGPACCALASAHSVPDSSCGVKAKARGAASRASAPNRLCGWWPSCSGRGGSGGCEGVGQGCGHGGADVGRWCARTQRRAAVHLLETRGFIQTPLIWRTAHPSHLREGPSDVEQLLRLQVAHPQLRLLRQQAPVSRGRQCFGASAGPARMPPDNRRGMEAATAFPARSGR